MFESLSTPDTKFGPTMYLVERIIFSTVKPPPNFWSKKKCAAELFSLDIYRRTQLLIQALRNVNKFYSDEILVAAVSRWNQKQLKKVYDLSVGAYNMGKLIQGLRFYAENEVAREKRIEAPKDESETVKPIESLIGIDLRKNKPKKKTAVWYLIGENKTLEI